MLENKQLNEELKQAQTMNEIMNILNKYYDLDSKLGLMNKGVVLMGMQQAIETIGIKKR